MDVLEPSVVPTDIGAVDLIDLLSVPTVGAAVLRHLRSKSALRQTCSEICALVDQHVEAFRVIVKGEKDVVLARQLARKALRPKQLTVVGSATTRLSSSMTALLADKQHRPMFQRVQRLKIKVSFPKYLQQDVFKAMPSLTHLTILPELSGHSAWRLAGALLTTLRSLNVHLDECHARLLRACTQLKTLILHSRSFKGASAIAQLTGLTRLALYSLTPGRQQFPAAEQSELGSALAALTNLQHLSISHAPPGPVTQALSQLTALTELYFAKQDRVATPGSLVLPNCVKVSFNTDISVQHVASIEAPQLQHLDVSLTVQPHELGTLVELCRGVLQACSCLSLELRAWSEEDKDALMAVLSQDWQPSAEALQPVRSNSNGLYQTTNSKPPRQWSLELCSTHCTRQCLELLPQGLGSLYLRGCTLDPDSLDPLAQVASLRELDLSYCTGVTIDALKGLFSTSVQGCLLSVCMYAFLALASAKACRKMRKRVLARREAVTHLC